MIIALGQTKPIKGNIPKNIRQHLLLVERAMEENADILIFPELSLTGYEPALAKKLAMEPGDPVLDKFQLKSNVYQMTIGVGMPVKIDENVCIGMVLFRPDQGRTLYTKKYLHEDEVPFFTSENHSPGLLGNVDDRIALAICYELSVPQHAKDALHLGANIYLASVAKTEDGLRKATIRLKELALKNQVMTMMVNSVGPQDNFIAAGQSAVWDSAGKEIGSLSENELGILLLDTDHQLIKKIVV